MPTDVAGTRRPLRRLGGPSGANPVRSLRPDLSSREESLYAFLTRNAVSASDYFNIPTPRVVELGTRVEM